jgi:hypothetical protein
VVEEVVDDVDAVVEADCVVEPLIGPLINPLVKELVEVALAGSKFWSCTPLTLDSRWPLDLERGVVSRFECVVDGKVDGRVVPDVKVRPTWVSVMYTRRRLHRQLFRAR